MTRLLRLAITCTVVAAGSLPAMAQISFTSALDLAQKNSPSVRMAQANVDKANAALSQSRDVYIPSVAGGSGLGYSYGFPVGQPSVFNFTMQSLVFNFSQGDYIRASRFALNAAELALQDAQQAVTEDVAVTYVALDRDSQRQKALSEQAGYATRLIDIIQERLDAGQDTPIDLTGAQLSAAQIKLAKLRSDDEAENDQAHLALLIGVPAQGLGVVSSSIPPFTAPPVNLAESAPQSSPSVASAYATANAKQKIALGDARYLWRPQIAFAAQYNRYAKFNNYDLYYSHFQHNNFGIGVEITLPIFDMSRRAKARESAADAIYAAREADQARDQFLEGRQKMRHATSELAAQAQVAALDQQLAQQQLDILAVQLKSGSGNPSAPQMTPKDEEKSRIGEREKFLTVLDTSFEMRKAEINLLRQTGQLEDWVKSVAQSQSSTGLKPE
ncbi:MULTISPECIES: TolC family protein [Acidobacteriaceae]|uniref:TolC family protein n=1 Tax=Acidobacteriaceae TaxID=204434 RepID=UPI00131DCA55|nr:MULTISPECIES: TolC family protein [Acidobacteriaceae]MDW5266465.1 TolC family protein [Edaphobacter sp.]